jgi:hypothetical protein
MDVMGLLSGMPYYAMKWVYFDSNYQILAIYVFVKKIYIMVHRGTVVDNWS